MADFFQRLSEHTIYPSTGVKPLLAPHFAAPTAFSRPSFEPEHRQQAAAEFTDAPNELMAASPRPSPLVAPAAQAGAAATPALQLRQLTINRSHPLQPAALRTQTEQMLQPGAPGEAMPTTPAGAPHPDLHSTVTADRLPEPAPQVASLVTTVPVQGTTLPVLAAADQPPATNIPPATAAAAVAAPKPPAVDVPPQQHTLGQTTKATALQPERITAGHVTPLSPLVSSPAAERAQPTGADSALPHAPVTPAAVGHHKEQLPPAALRPVPAPAVVGERTVAAAPRLPSVTDSPPAIAGESAVNQPLSPARQPLVTRASANVPFVQRTPLVVPGSAPVKPAGTAPTAPTPQRATVQGQIGGAQTTTSGAVGPTHQPSGMTGGPSALGRGGEASMASPAQSQQYDPLRANSGQPNHQVHRAIGAVNDAPTPIDIADQLNWPPQPQQPAQQGDHFTVVPLLSQPGVVPPWQQPNTFAMTRPHLGATVPAQVAPAQGAPEQEAVTQGAPAQVAPVAPTVALVRPNGTTVRLPALVAGERALAAARTPPTIRVTIGRIEVRTASEPPAAPRHAIRTALSLDEYLQKRQRRSR